MNRQAQAKLQAIFITRCARLKPLLWLTIIGMLQMSCNRQADQQRASPEQERQFVQLHEEANAQLQRHNLDSVEVYLQQAQHLAAIAGEESPTYWRIRTVFAKAAYRKGNYESALAIVLENLPRFTAINDRDAVADLRNLLGLIFLMQGRRDAALSEFRQAEEMNRAIGAQRRLVVNHFNMGLAYREKQHYALAKQYFDESKKMAEEGHHTELRWMSINRLAESHEKLGALDSAIFYYQAVLRIDTLINDWEIGFASTGLAECLIKQQKNAQAITFASRGYQLAKKVGAKWDISRAATVLSSAYAQIGDFEKAYSFLKIDDLYKDSLLTENKRIAMDSLQIAHQQVVNQQLLDQRDLAEQKFKISLLAIGILVIVAVSTTVLFYVIRRHAKRIRVLNEHLLYQTNIIQERNDAIHLQNLALEASNETKAFLLAVLSHDLRSPFSSMLSLLRLFKDGELSAAVHPALFENLYFQTLNTSNMIDNLILWADNQKAGENRKPVWLNIATEVDSILSSLQEIIKQKNIRVAHQPAAQHVALKIDRNHFRIIIQNLLTNAVKFTADAGVITICYEKKATGMMLSIKDSGVGMDKTTVENMLNGTSPVVSTSGTNAEKGYGIGMQLITKYVKMNQGQLTIESKVGMGSTFMLTFPLDS